MKYLLIILLSLFGLSASAQLMQTNGTAGGYQFVGLKSDSLHIIPRGTDTPNIGGTKYGKSTVGAMFYKTTDGTLWIRSSVKWNQVVGTGGGTSGITSLGQGYGVIIANDSTYNVDSSLFISVQHFYNTIDSVINAISSSGIDSIVVNSPLAIDFTNRKIPVISYTGDTTRYFVFESPIQADDHGDTVYVSFDSTGNGDYSIAHHSFGYYLGVFLTRAQADQYYISYDSALGKFVDTGYSRTDSFFLVKNGVEYLQGIAAGSGGDTTVFESVIDSTGQAGQRVLFSGGDGHIKSDAYFLYDSVRNKLVINHRNVSVGGNGIKLWVQGDTYLNGNLGLFAPTVQSDTALYKPLVISPNTAGGSVFRLNRWPIVNDPSKLRAVDTVNLSYRIDTLSTKVAASGSGTVTNVATNDATGIKGGTITTTGTLRIDTTIISSRAWRDKLADSLGALIALKGSGTVTSLTQGYGILNSTNPITTTGTQRIDTFAISTRAWRDKLADSLGVLLGLKVKYSDTLSMLAPYVAGGSITWPGALYSTPTTATVTTHNINFAPSLANQSAYTILGNHTSGSATPTFAKINVLSINATGTPSSSTVLYGDGTWAAVSGGGGTAAGSTGNIQFKRADGAFSAVTTLTYDSTNAMVGIGIASPTSSLHVVSGSGLPALGAELLSASGWTSTNWTGSFGAGWTHTSGNTTALTNTLAAANGTGYYITLVVSGGTTGTFTVAFGGVASNTISGAGTFDLSLSAISTGTLSIAPSSLFDRQIIISIKAITGSSTPIAVFANNTTGSIQFRSDSTFNTFVGNGAGARTINSNGGATALTGANNTGFGYAALNLNVSGASNTAVGALALSSLTYGGENTAIGQGALSSCTSCGGATNGNTAIGYNAMSTSTGTRNVAVGAASLVGNISNATAVGWSAGGAATAQSSYFGNQSGTQNAGASLVAIGYQAGGSNTSFTANNTTSIGMQALWRTTGNGNTAVGMQALSAIAGTINHTGTYNTAIGFQAVSNATTVISGSNNIGVGASADLPDKTASNQIVFQLGQSTGTGGYNAWTHFGGTVGSSGGATLINHTTSAVTTQNTSTALEVLSTTGGILFPRMTVTQAGALTTPPDGLVIYVTNTDATFTAIGFWGRVSGAWAKLN